MSGAQGQPFLALWNGIASAQLQAEYESWHSFEHVPERVGLPGFVEAVRYRGVAQPLRYFTFYSLQSLAALETPEYREVFTHPTPWSARMRLVLRDFYRMPCHSGGVHGLGMASQLATVQWRGDAPDLGARLDAWLGAQVLQGAVLRAQWGVAAPGQQYPLANTASSLQGPGQDHLLLLQHLDAPALQRSASAVVAFLQGLGARLMQPEYFSLLTQVRKDGLDGPPGQRRAPQTLLFEHFQKG